MISDYASLQQAVADWLARADLTAQIPTFVALAEARLNRDLRMAAMQATVTGTLASDNTITLPDDCRQVQSLRVNLGDVYVEVHPLPPERLADTLATAAPAGYVRVGNVLQLIGGSGQPDYALTYWQAVPALSTANTNWLIVREPGLYLYATLLEASPYLQDTGMAQVWVQQYQSILAGMQAEDDRARYGNAPAIQSPVSCPP